MVSHKEKPECPEKKSVKSLETISHANTGIKPGLHWEEACALTTEPVRQLNQ